MGSMLAAWRVSLRRTRADWPIVGAAGLITLLAAVLLAAGPMYASAAAEAGLRRSLADAPLADANLRVSLYAPADRAAEVDRAVVAELGDLLGALGGQIVGEWRSTGTLALRDLPGISLDDQAVVGAAPDLEELATLVDGAWPADRPTPDAPIEAVVLDTVAADLGLTVGQELTLVARPSTDPVDVPLRIVGLIAIDASAGAFWSADDQLLTGRHDNGRYLTYGPFLATQRDLVERAGVGGLELQWTTLADYERLDAADADRLEARVRALQDRLAVATGVPVQVATQLPEMLDAADRSLLVSRASVLLVMAQLGILAAYAIVLTASLLVEHRRIDTALLRSRGATARDVALLALAEALLIAVPAVLVAPWLAAAALGGLAVAGPLAEAGLRIVPRVGLDAYVAAGAAGLVSVILLALPAALAARAFAAERGGLSRHLTRTIGQRLGLDVALLAVTGIALWQLRLYGAPLTRTVQGSLGIDPLLVAAPAIGLLAGGVVALRVLPLLAEGLEAAVSRGSGLVAALGARQLARRPLRYTRSALLLMLAVSMGVFAISYASTWSGSQGDQAAYQAGADVRVTASSSAALPMWALAGAYGRLPGVQVASPVERLPSGLTFAGAASTAVLAIDAGQGEAIVRFRPDEAGTSLSSLLAPLRAARPELTLATLPEGTASVRILPDIDAGAIVVEGFDPLTGEITTTPIDPAEIRVRAHAIVVDAHGILLPVQSDLVAMPDWGDGLVLDLTPTDARSEGLVAETGASPEGPLRLAGLGIDLWLPGFALATEGRFGVAGVATASHEDGTWTALPLEAAGPWRAAFAQGRRLFEPVAPAQVAGTSLSLGGGGADFIGGEGPRSAGARLSFLPASIADWTVPLPVVVNRAFATEIEAAEGDGFVGAVAGTSRQFKIAGIVESFPTTDPAEPLVVMDQPSLALIRLQRSGTADIPTEWWLATADGQAAAVATALRNAPFASRDVVSVDSRARALRNDAVALGIIGALALGSLATGLFAIVGLTVSTAVSARQRRTEFALLRALGLSGRQLSGTLWLENASLVVVSLAAGTGLGLVIGWLVLPFVTVTQRATTPVPPVLVEVPWDQVAILNAASAVALGVAVLVIGRLLRRLGMGSILRMGED